MRQSHPDRLAADLTPLVRTGVGFAGYWLGHTGGARLNVDIDCRAAGANAGLK
ncbi:MAG TPA: hypothetical protein VGQ52_02745 [Gemmatimonadaceae bacterium]|nr:hypothetical protein [Gemmatimonadaceae bacterium]